MQIVETHVESLSDLVTNRMLFPTCHNLWNGGLVCGHFSVTLRSQSDKCKEKHQGSLKMAAVIAVARGNSTFLL